VEIGECANEWRGFKKWSKDQKPRTFKRESCLDCEKRGFSIYNPPKEDDYWCDTCSGFLVIDKNPLLEEFVDGEHFFIELALELGIDPDDFYAYDEPLVGDTEEIFTEVMYHHVCMVKGETSSKRKKLQLRIAHAIYLNLALQRLNFTWKQIEQAYMDKNKINHHRQSEGY
jgi:dimeric dUTPase (all-alpha-NTP-PPase superfamily)